MLNLLCVLLPVNAEELAAQSGQHQKNQMFTTRSVSNITTKPLASRGLTLYRSVIMYYPLSDALDKSFLARFHFLFSAAEDGSEKQQVEAAKNTLKHLQIHSIFLCCINSTHHPKGG